MSEKICEMYVSKGSCWGPQKKSENGQQAGENKAGYKTISNESGLQ